MWISSCEASFKFNKNLLQPNNHVTITPVDTSCLAGQQDSIQGLPLRKTVDNHFPLAALHMNTVKAIACFTKTRLIITYVINSHIKKHNAVNFASKSVTTTTITIEKILFTYIQSPLVPQPLGTTDSWKHSLAFPSILYKWNHTACVPLHFISSRKNNTFKFYFPIYTVLSK